MAISKAKVMKGAAIVQGIKQQGMQQGAQAVMQKLAAARPPMPPSMPAPSGPPPMPAPAGGAPGMKKGGFVHNNETFTKHSAGFSHHNEVDKKHAAGFTPHDSITMKKGGKC
jgi:hypothetical protein